MAYPKLSIHIVTWNSMRFLPDLLESIMGQTYKDFNVLVIDNASTDKVEGFLGSSTLDCLHSQCP